MSNLLKDIYSAEFYNLFSDVVCDVMPTFDKSYFTSLIFDNQWKDKELKDRMRHTAGVLHQFFPSDFKATSLIIKNLISQLIVRKITKSSLEFMFIPEYIQRYGIGEYETSISLIEYVTQFTSCEFAVRAFILAYPEKMLEQMYIWSTHKNHHVRRLASEGARPRLPWAIALPSLKNNPAPLLPILENLKEDSSEYVRRSVANNLNDIAKDNPDFVINIAKKWKGISKDTDWIIKHGCRTLLKQANADVLAYYGLGKPTELGFLNYSLLTHTISIGDRLTFSFCLHNNRVSHQSLRIEYAIYYRKQNGLYAKKVFSVRELHLAPQQSVEIQRNHNFRIITTRRYYAGTQKLSIIVNGQELVTSEFELTM